MRQKSSAPLSVLKQPETFCLTFNILRSRSGEGGLLKQLTKAVLERAMQAELTAHLGYERHDASGDNSGNSRNGKSKKTLNGLAKRSSSPQF